MTIQIQHTGEVFTLPIPTQLIEQLGWTVNSSLEVVVQDNELVIKTVPTYRLEDLIAQVTDDNIHEEQMVAPPIGKEIW